MRKFFLLLLSLIPFVVFAQDSVVRKVKVSDEKDNRPKIGLVLSGGGAKGLAHIGILKAIERAGLKIDYITGTSMGAIVAAMYASGYSAEQIEHYARTLDWMKLISSKPMYQDIGIENKDEFNNYLITMPMKGIRPQLSSGIFIPYEVTLMLKEIFFPVYDITDFSKLKIPFKCVAADVGTGDAVVLDHGDLAFATRCSMAIPGVFSAVEYGDTKLIDGGVVRNFPVKDVREMGADYVIGVNLFSGLTPAEDVNSAIDVMLQVTNFRDAKDLEEEKAICDMIIEPDVAQYNAASFAAADTILLIGDRKGEEYEPLFKQLADKLYYDYGVPYAKVEGLSAYNSQVRIAKFQIEGLDKTPSSFLKHTLNLHEGQQYTPQDFTNAIKFAMSTGYYKNISYDLIPVEDSPNSVIFKCTVQENPQSSLKIGLSYNTFTGASVFLDYQRRNLFDKHSITDYKIAISKNFRARVKNRRYFGNRNNFYTDAKFDFSCFKFSSYNDDDEKDNDYTYDHSDLSFTVGHAYSLTSDISFKIGWENFHLDPEIVSPAYIKGNISNFYLGFARRKNTLERKFLPRTGVRIDAECYVAFKPNISVKNILLEDSVYIRDYLDENIVARATCRAEFHQAVAKKLSLSEVIAAAIGYNNKAFVHKTAVGGCEQHLPSHFNFYGLVAARRFESTMAMARFSLQYNFMGELYFLLHANAGITFQNLDAYIHDDESFKVDDWLFGGGATIAYNFFDLLPMDITLMYSPEDKFNVSVNVGFFF